MRVFSLFDEAWDLLAEVEKVNGEDVCQVVDMLTNCEAQYEATVAGLLTLMETIAQRDGGLEIYSTKLIHHVNDDPKIFEFRKGRYRVLWAYGVQKRQIYLLETFLKTTQKVPPEKVGSAIRQLKKMQRAFGKGTIERVVDYGN